MMYKYRAELQKTVKRIYSTKKFHTFTVPGILFLCLQDNCTGFCVDRIEYT